MATKITVTGNVDITKLDVLVHYSDEEMMAIAHAIAQMTTNDIANLLGNLIGSLYVRYMIGNMKSGAPSTHEEITRRMMEMFTQALDELNTNPMTQQMITLLRSVIQTRKA